VLEACTIPEALAAQNATLTNCGAPVRDRSEHLVTVSNVMTVLAGVFVLVRIVYKIVYMRSDLGLDDWFVTGSMAAAAATAAVTAHGIAPNGVGRDIWTLTGDQITNAIRFFFIEALIYFFKCMLIKLSLICFFMRIFTSRGTRNLLWATFIFTVLWGFTFVMATIFECKPISYFWDQWDGLHEGHCVSSDAIAWANAAINIALDFWILAIPLYQLHGLQLHWKKKVSVGLMFSVGLFVTIVSILRLQSLVNFTKTMNRTWEFYHVCLWSTIEICVGIICACLPTVRLLLVRIFPVLGGTTRSRPTYGQRYGDVLRSGVSGTGVSAAQVTTGDRPESSISDGQPVIISKKTWTVQYSDNDESSLVGLSDLDQGGKQR